jgi:tRNA-splicing ligase RtcB
VTTRLTTFGPVDAPVHEQIANCQGVEEGALAVLCADNHLGYSMPIGGVVGYESFVSPSAVGFDIACGNCAVKTDLVARDLDVARAMDEVFARLSFGVGRKNSERVEHPVIDEIAECTHPVQRTLAQLAASQLGTIGSGNHYVDLLEDQADGALWIGVHFGSRGLGHKTASWALERAGAKGDGMMAPPVVIPIDSELGALYLDGMERAGRYAYAGRDWVVARVAALLGAAIVDRVHNHHNFAWRETHHGRSLLVHRKGATPAFPGQRGFVGGTMGEPAVILEGVESPTSQSALYSTVHGAGRVLSRTAAAGRIKRVTARVCENAACASFNQPLTSRDLRSCPSCGGVMHKRPYHLRLGDGLIDFRSVQADLKSRGIELRGAGADEAPACYKRLTDVLAHHAGTIKVTAVLKPIGVAMAGEDVVDPFKD